MKTKTTITALLLLAVAIPAWSNPDGIVFPDILGHPQGGNILLVADEGWMTGYEDGNFYPDREITQRQAWQVLNRWRPNLTRGDLAELLYDQAAQVSQNVRDGNQPANAAPAATLSPRFGGVLVSAFFWTAERAANAKALFRIFNKDGSPWSGLTELPLSTNRGDKAGIRRTVLPCLPELAGKKVMVWAVEQGVAYPPLTDGHRWSTTGEIFILPEWIDC